MSLRDDLRRRVNITSLDSMPAHYTATLDDEGNTFRASAVGDDAVAIDLANNVVTQAIEVRRVRTEGGVWDAVRIRCHPTREEYSRARWRAQQWEFDATMDPNRIEVTPFAYAENIQCQIGFNGPKAGG